MANEKATNQELLKLRRDMALRQLALAVRYPQAHTGMVLHRKHTNGAIPVAPEMGWLSPSVSSEGSEMHNVVSDRLGARLQAAAPPATTAAISKDLRERQKGVRENSEVPVSVAKPWKKPWDR
jgi:hypothetical protein